MTIQSSSKKMISSLIIAGGILLSATANAQQSTIEISATEFVVQQSQQLVEEMAVQLKESIANEISQFSVAESLIWGSEEIKETVSHSQKPKQVSKADNNPKIINQ